MKVAEGNEPEGNKTDASTRKDGGGGAMMSVTVKKAERLRRQKRQEELQNRPGGEIKIIGVAREGGERINGGIRAPIHPKVYKTVDSSLGEKARATPLKL